MGGFLRAFRRAAIVMVLIGVLVLVFAVPAFAYVGTLGAGNTFYDVSLNVLPMTNPPSQTYIDGCRIRSYVATANDSSPPPVSWGPKFAPGFDPMNEQCGFWPIPVTNSLVWSGIGREVAWGQNLGAVQWSNLFPHPRPVVARFTISSANNPCRKKLHWEFDFTWTDWWTNPPNYSTYHVAPNPNFWANVQWGSQPALSNPDMRYDEDGDLVTNTYDMVLRNVQYAQSPRALGGEELSLDNPVVIGLFAASEDAARVGPIVVAPGETAELSAMPSSIEDPVPGGRTLLMKGELEENGSTVPFLMQFGAVDDTPIVAPASSWWSLSALAAFAFGVIFISRKRPAGL